MQEDLEKHAGIPDIDVVDPAVPGFAQRAAFLLDRDGVSSLAASIHSHPAASGCLPAALSSNPPLTAGRLHWDLIGHSTAWSKTCSTRSVWARSGAAAKSASAKWSDETPTAEATEAHTAV